MHGQPHIRFPSTIRSEMYRIYLCIEGKGSVVCCEWGGGGSWTTGSSYLWYRATVTPNQLCDVLTDYCQEDVLKSFLYPPPWLMRLVAGHSPRRSRVRFWARSCCAGVGEGGTSTRFSTGISVGPDSVYFTNTPYSFVYYRHCTIWAVVIVVK